MRWRAGIERELASRADQRVLRWFGHVERMDVYRMDRRVVMAGVSGGRVRGRPRLGWMDGVKVVGNRGMTVEAARKIGKSGEPCYICNKSFTSSFLLAPVFFRIPLQCSGGFHVERGGMALHDAVWINCKRAQLLNGKAQMSSIWAKGVC